MKLFDLRGKAAIVTGGNGGIGLGIARGLAAAGASIAIVGRNPQKTDDAGATLAQEFDVRVISIVADLTDPSQVEEVPAAVQSQLGRVDILVNNAGINIRKPPQDMTLEEWQQVMDANLTSVFLLSRGVYPILKQAGGGKIINIGSMTSIFGASFAPAYATTKGGVVQLTKSCALAWANDNIQVNAILPGWFDTDLTQRARVEVPELYNRVVARIPMGRWAKPAEIAGTAVWLASAASDYVTGVAVPVDGGYSSAL